MIRWPLSSLRFRLLLPILLVSLLAAAVVAAASLYLGKQWAMRDVNDRFIAVEQTVREASFPLTPSVVSSLARLSRTELLAVDDRGRIVASTLPLTDAEIAALKLSDLATSKAAAEFPASVSLSGGKFLVFRFIRNANRGNDIADDPRHVVVLFDQASVDAARRRAGLLPLMTGLSTIVLLTSLMLVLTTRLTGRLSKLKREVERIASGDFESSVADNGPDEVGLLGTAVDKMTRQLQQLWLQVNRQQREKLLHQVGAGMAHQLRNTLTGARLALELHRQDCPHGRSDELEVALREMEVAEDYVKRLLVVGAQPQQNDEAALVSTCIRNVLATHAAVAKHLRVELDWQYSERDLKWVAVQDGATFTAAISNLVLNALQAGSSVSVEFVVESASRCHVHVSDNGPGFEPGIAEQVFEPFITSKPEGLGLGLPLVRRAAEKLNGGVEWRRENERTSFHFWCPVRLHAEAASNAESSLG